MTATETGPRARTDAPTTGRYTAEELSLPLFPDLT